MNNLNIYKKALFIAAHPDDTEISAGGLLQRLLEQGCKIYHLCLSNPIISMPEGYGNDSFLKEMENAHDLLGINKKARFNYDIPARKFPQYRQEILEEFVAFRKEINPDLVICHSEKDIHQDHKTVGEEAIRAFRTSTILTYTHPWNSRGEEKNVFIELSEKMLNKKQQAIECYKTQQGRHYMLAERVRALALTTGMMTGVNLAEGFCLKRSTVRLAKDEI